MRVAVTGSGGYIGRVLARRLVDLGHEVIGIDSELFAGCSYDESAPSWHARTLDVRDVRAEDLAGVEAVCHLAALSNDPMGELDPALTRAINLDGTMTVARAAKDAGARRFVFASSCSVYGQQPEGRAATEDSPLVPLSAYAASKVDAEAALHDLASRDFSPVYLRQATAFGWSERFRFDLVLNNFVGWALSTGSVKLLSDGSAWRPIAHVADLAEAFACAVVAERGAVHDIAMNVGGDAENHRIRDLARLAADAVGARVTVAADAAADRRSYRVSFARIAERLPAWRPARTAAAGAREMKDALLARGFTAAHFTDERFTRLRRLAARREHGELDASLRPVAVSAS
jgi:nucleoside-diphosphate-sugar epimerase